MGQQLARSRLLLGSQLAVKGDIEWFPREALVENLRFDRQTGKQILHRLETTTRQRDVLRQFFRKR